MSNPKQPTNILRDVMKRVVNDELISFEFKIDRKLEALEEKIEAKALARHSLVMNALDKVTGMFKNHDDEHIILKANHARILDHDRRLETIEKIHPQSQHASA